MKKQLIALLMVGAFLFSVSPSVFAGDVITKDPDLGELD